MMQELKEARAGLDAVAIALRNAAGKCAEAGLHDLAWKCRNDGEAYQKRGDKL